MLAQMFTRPADLKTAVDRRSRAAVVWGLIFFVGLQAGFYLASDWWPPLADGEYGHKLTHLRAQLAAKPKDQPGVVMFGSSMTGWALDPAAMANLKPGSPGGPVVYNFGINGCGPIVHLLCLRRLLADGVHPDLVLLETEPRFMSRIYSVVYSEHYLLTPRVQFQDFAVLNRYDPKARELRAEWLSRAWLPWYYHRLDLQNAYLNEWVPTAQRMSYWDFTDRNGWEGPLAARANTHPPLEGKALEIASQYHQHAINVTPTFDGTCRAYREMVETCRRHHIRVMFVRMPENSCMRQYEPALKERIEAFYADLKKDTGVGFIDARDWVDDAGFIDGTHLVPEGAVQYSSKLGLALEPLLYPDRLAKSGR